MDVLTSAARDEALKRAVDSLTELIAEADDVTLGRESLRRFSEYAARLRTLLQDLQAGRRRVETRAKSEILRSALQTLDTNVRKACGLIAGYKSGSRFRLMLNRHSIQEQLQKTAVEIARAVQLLDLANLETTLDLKAKIQGDIIRGLESLEFKAASASEAVASELEKSVAQKGRSREYTMKLLQQVAEALGVDPDASLVRREIAILKRDKEELEERKQHGEALQLSQLIQLLHSTEVAPPTTTPTPAVASTSSQGHGMIVSFTCPLSRQLMEDPVAVVCGHSFERKAIAEHFGRGERRCPTCEEELPSLELTHNVSLRSSIQEWKQRTAQSKLQNALSGMESEEPDVLNQVVADLCFSMETIEDCIDQVMEARQGGIVPKLVELLKMDGVDTRAALKCLCYMARYSDENKEVIAQNGAIRCIVKLFCRGITEPEAVEVLLELSQNEALAEQIGSTKDSIPSLVSLLQNSNPEISQTARSVLLKLSSNVHFVIKMADARHFEPFLGCFNQGQPETRASMARELTRMQLSEDTAIHFEDKQFVNALTKTLYSNSPACKSASLRCIRKLVAFNRLARLFLADRDTIPALLGLMSSMGSEPVWKQEATEIFISLVRASLPSDYQNNPSLRELHSEHNIHTFLQLASTSIPQTRVSLLSLLVAMVEKSEIARDMIQSDVSAMARLFSTLEGGGQVEVRLHAMKLISCVAKDHPDGILLPESPAKESVITGLVNIFTSSPSNEERAAAAGIIGCLPSDDAIVNDMLQRSGTLKTIHQVISAAEDGEPGMRKETLVATTPSCLLENALAALLQYTEPTKPELQRQVANLKLYPSLVRLLSTGSSLVKQRAAIALAHLSQSTQLAARTTANTEKQVINLVPMLWLTRFLHIKSWCCPSSLCRESLCSIHGSACSYQHTLCLIKADAVRPLVQILRETDCGVSEAAMTALDTLLMDDRTISHGTAAIVESQGVDAILEVLERGCKSAKDKALDLFLKILQHSAVTDNQFPRSKGILIHHLLQDNSLKKKAALVLSQMGIIPTQSSYF